MWFTHVIGSHGDVPRCHWLLRLVYYVLIYYGFRIRLIWTLDRQFFESQGVLGGFGVRDWPLSKNDKVIVKLKKYFVEQCFNHWVHSVWYTIMLLFVWSDNWAIYAECLCSESFSRGVILIHLSMSLSREENTFDPCHAKVFYSGSNTNFPIHWPSKGPCQG